MPAILPATHPPITEEKKALQTLKITVHRPKAQLIQVNVPCYGKAWRPFR
jgi:hypothetical protein